MGKRLSFKINFVWMLGGNIFYAACQWAMLVIIAKLGDPEMVGRFVLGLALSAPVIMFSNLNLRLVLATDSRKTYSFHSYLALRLISAPLAALVIAGIALFMGYPLETTLVVIVVGAAKAFEATSDIYYGLMQFHERLDRIAKSMILKGFLSLGLLGIGVYMSGSILWGAIGLACAMALTLFAYDLRSARHVVLLSGQESEAAAESALTPHWDAHLLWQLALFTLPLGVMVLLQSLNTNIPRFFIERYLGEHSLGIFAALAYVMVAGTTMVRALGHSLSPVMARYYNDGRRKSFYRSIAFLLAAGIGIGLAGMGIAALAGRWILRIMYTPEYANHASLFVYIMFASLFLFVAQLLDYALAVVRNFHAQMTLAIVVSGVTLLLSFWRIPRAGLWGASQALLWGGVVKVLGNLGILALSARKKSSQRAPGVLPIDILT